MTLLSEHHHFRPADDRFADVPAPTADLFADILVVCPRAKTMAHSAAAARLAQLIDAGAWTDAALALLALELPRWQVRRLAYDDGEWYCALSDHREMPDWLDASVETHHADMALAVLSAVLQARLEGHTSDRPEVAMGPDAPSTSYEPICCENFA
ncbi:MAG: hypothetical protein JWR49_1701 [Tardiphaga sp.]|nr:hypothetical protein [Tardiphaga sp.]